MTRIHLRTRTIDRAGPFPTTPRSIWTPEQRARWQTARKVADAAPGNRPGGWTDEASGHFPGTYRALTIWALAPVAALVTFHRCLDPFGQTTAAYLAAGVGVLLVLAGGLVHLAVWGGYRTGTPTRHQAIPAYPIDQLAVLAGRSTRTGTVERAVRDAVPHLFGGNR